MQSNLKQYTNSKGESLPKVICAVVEFEKARQQTESDNLDLIDQFIHSNSLIYSEKTSNIWSLIACGHYATFYSIFPTCKNSRGQELPEEIQVEIVEERLRQWGKTNANDFAWGINVLLSEKQVYWKEIYHDTDYTTKPDDTFTQGEIVEVSQDNIYWNRREFISTYKEYFITFNPMHDFVSAYKYLRKIQPLELTLPELLTIAEEVKGTKVKLKS